MALSSTAASWFVSDMVKITSDAWLKGWDERNGGNVSFRLLEQDVQPYLAGWHESRVLPLEEPLPSLAGEYFLVTGSGKYFRNVQLNPEANLGVIRVSPGGRAVAVCWGYSDGAVPTSELSAHLKSHAVRQQRGPRKTGRNRPLPRHQPDRAVLCAEVRHRQCHARFVGRQHRMRRRLSGRRRRDSVDGAGHGTHRRGDGAEQCRRTRWCSGSSTASLAPARRPTRPSA